MHLRIDLSAELTLMVVHANTGLALSSHIQSLLTSCTFYTLQKTAALDGTTIQHIYLWLEKTADGHTKTADSETDCHKWQMTHNRRHARIIGESTEGDQYVGLCVTQHSRDKIS